MQRCQDNFLFWEILASSTQFLEIPNPAEKQMATRCYLIGCCSAFPAEARCGEFPSFSRSFAARKVLLWILTVTCCLLRDLFPIP